MIENFNETFYRKTGLQFNTYYKKIRPKLIYYFKFHFKKNDIEANDLCDETFERVLQKINEFNKTYAITANVLFIPTQHKSFYEKELLYEQCEYFLLEMLYGKKITDFELPIYKYENVKNEKIKDIENSSIHLNKYIKRNDSMFSINIDDILFKCTESKHNIIDEVIKTEDGFYIIEVINTSNVIFDTWLFKIAKNFSLIHSKNTITDSIEEEDGVVQTSYDNDIDINSVIHSNLHYNPHDENNINEKVNALYESIERLKEPNKTMLLMQIQKDSSYEDIARVYDKPIKEITDKYINKCIRFNFDGIDLRTFTKFSNENEICGKLYDINEGKIHIIFNSDRKKVSHQEQDYLARKVDWYTNDKNERIYIFNPENISNIFLLYNLQNVKNKIFNSKKELHLHLKEYV
jgi:DNA-directed RNA polymerase specialized sigma24 family protein